MILGWLSQTFLTVLIGCNGEKPVYGDFSSKDLVEVSDEVEPSGEPSTETGDTTDTQDTSANTAITFRSLNMDCARLEKRTLTFTRVLPGGLSPDGQLLAEFLEEKQRFYLWNDDNVDLQPSTDIPTDCTFSVELSTPPSEDLEEVTLNDNGEVTEIGVQWAFYYPATFVHEDVACSKLELSESNVQKISCVSTYTQGVSTEPLGAIEDPTLDNALDMYDWGSDVMAVYVQGNIQGSFSDLGFAVGWNLAKFSQGEMVLVEPVGDLDQLDEIYIDNRAFLPRYKVNGKGAVSAEADYTQTYSIGVVPVKWLMGVTSVNTLESMYVQDNVVSWSLEIWGKPTADTYLSANISTSSSFYEQWSSEVDIAPFVPTVFYGQPSTYQSGISHMGSPILPSSSWQGSVCKDSATLAFLFFKPAKRPSDVLWYRLTNKTPGWVAYYGNQGDVSSWRKVLENTDSASPYTYTNLNIGPSCDLLVPQP